MKLCLQFVTISEDDLSVNSPPDARILMGRDVVASCGISFPATEVLQSTASARVELAPNDDWGETQLTPVVLCGVLTL
jgi:hypothetical protein